MQRADSIVAVAAATALLAACGQSGAKTETAAGSSSDDHAATASPATSGGMAANMPQTPYSASEQQMHQAMMQAVGGDAQHTYALKMIAHHRGAVEMSRVLMGQNPDPELRRMAQKTMTMQQQEIAELERWVANHTARAGAGASPTGTAQAPAG